MQLLHGILIQQKDLMIGRLEKELHVLQTQRNVLSNLSARTLDASTLGPYTSTIQSISTVSSLLITSLAEILQPSHIHAIFEALTFSLSTTTSQLVAAFPAQAKPGIKQKNENLCSICCQNIHQNNIKDAKVGLEKDHQQKFRMAMEQFNRISDQEIFSHEEQSIYDNELYKHLSQKQKIFNIKTNRIEEFIDLMESSLMTLQSIEQKYLHDSHAMQKFSRFSSINSFLSEFLQNSFSKKIPPWIHKVLSRFLALEKAHAMEKRRDFGVQTLPMITDEHRQLANQKKKLEKQFRKKSKQLEEFRAVNQKLEKMNRQLNKQLLDFKKGSHNRRQTSQLKQKKNVQDNNGESDRKPQPQPQNQKDLSGESMINSFMDTALQMGSKKQRKSIPSSILPRIRTSREETAIESSMKLPSNKEYSITGYHKVNERSKNNIEPFENGITEEKHQNELEKYVAFQKTASLANIIKQKAGSPRSEEDKVMEKNDKRDSHLLKVSKRSLKHISKKNITRVKASNTSQSKISESNIDTSHQDQENSLRSKENNNNSIQSNHQKDDNRNSQTRLSKIEKNKKPQKKLSSQYKVEKSPKKHQIDKIDTIQDRQEVQKAELVSDELKSYAQMQASKIRLSILEKSLPKPSKSLAQKINIEFRQTEHQSLVLQNQNYNEIIKERIERNSSPIPNKLSLDENISLDKERSFIEPHIIKKSKKANTVNESKNMIKQTEMLNIYQVLKGKKMISESISYQQFQRLFKKEEKTQQNKENQVSQSILLNDSTIRDIFSYFFIDSKRSLQYEESQQKSYHKKNIQPLNKEQKNLCALMFRSINNLKGQQKRMYKTVSALLRSPYQTMFNNLRFVDFISEMQEDTFEYYFKRILRIHRKCPLTASHTCQHLQGVQKILQNINSN